MLVGYRLPKVLISILFLLTNGSGPVFAQERKTTSDSQIWLQYLLNVRVHPKWSIHFDGGYRRKDSFINKPLNWLGRTSAIYHFNEKMNLATGYAFFSSFVETPVASYYRNEHRPYARFTIIQNARKLQIQHRFRTELRNLQKGNNQGLTNDYLTYFRLGYQLNLHYPLRGNALGKGVPYLIAYNEIMINAGDQALSVFDQSRTFFGVGYGITSTFSISFGGQYIYQQKNKDTFENLSTLRLNIIQNLDFRKPDTDNTVQ